MHVISLSSVLIGLVAFYFSWMPLPADTDGSVAATEMSVCNSSGSLIADAGSPGLAKKRGSVGFQRDATTVWLEVVPEQMKFDLDTFAVKAGKKIILELDNRDGMQHNLLILKPNSLQTVGEAADAMLRDPKASEKHYVPDMPEVLFATEMLGPNDVYTLKFTAPTQPGYYPFVCTFPGHWRMMNGVMVVEKP